MGEITIKPKNVHNLGRMWDGSYEYCFNVPEKLNIKCITIELNE